MAIKIGSIASGMGMHLHGLKKLGGSPVWAVECDGAIAHCYKQNHQGQIYLKPVQSLDLTELPDIDLLIATPSCKNASTAKGSSRGETAEDYAVGEAIALTIQSKLPKFFLLENVWGYRNFKAFERIKAALNEYGYYFNYYNFNAADWGVAQSRRRLYLMAVRGGSFFNPVPPKVSLGWGEAIADIIPTLTEYQLTKLQLDSILRHSTTGTQLIRRVGARVGSDRPYAFNEPAFTIRALGRSCDRHWHQADVYLNGKAHALSPRACLRLFGDKEIADSIWLPPTKSLAMEVVGNGASWAMFEALGRSLLATNQKPFFLSVA
jgi:site-specific DNA-cytosine methylase